MIIEIKELNEIYKILLQLQNREIDKVEKKWLTTEELSFYIGYSKESIKKMIRNKELKIDKHYFKKFKKNIFNKIEIDNWIRGIEQEDNQDFDFLTNKIIENIKEERT